MPTYLYRPYAEKKYVEQGSKLLNIMSTTVNTDKFAHRSGIRNLSLKSDSKYMGAYHQALCQTYPSPPYYFVAHSVTNGQIRN